MYAERLIAQGASVAIADVNGRQAERAAREINALANFMTGQMLVVNGGAQFW